MKRLLFMMVIVSTSIISTLNSCSKDESLTNNNGGGPPPPGPVTLNLTTNQWQRRTEGIFVNTFMRVIPATRANNLVKIYLVTNGEDILINQPIRFMDGSLWGTNTQADISINYRGNLQDVPYLNIKVVIM